MKRKWSTGLSVLLYIFFLTWVWGVEISRLLDIKLFLSLLAGAFLLTIPFYQKGIKREELFAVFGKKALEAGYIQTFLLLFIGLSEEEVRRSVVLSFRPVLYGFCLFVLFLQREEEQEEEAEQKKEIKKSEEEQENPLDAYETFRKKGLTKRETEIALLICKGCSNREIAEEFVISETTVKKHVSNIFEKTGIDRREELKKILRI